MPKRPAFYPGGASVNAVELVANGGKFVQRRSVPDLSLRSNVVESSAHLGAHARELELHCRHNCNDRQKRSAEGDDCLTPLVHRRDRITRSQWRNRRIRSIRSVSAGAPVPHSSGLTGLSMSSRPWNSRPNGPNEGQKFANDLAQEVGASQYGDPPTSRVARIQGNGHRINDYRVNAIRPPCR